MQNSELGLKNDKLSNEEFFEIPGARIFTDDSRSSEKILTKGSQLDRGVDSEGATRYLYKTNKDDLKGKFNDTYFPQDNEPHLSLSPSPLEKEEKDDCSRRYSLVQIQASCDDRIDFELPPDEDIDPTQDLEDEDDLSSEISFNSEDYENMCAAVVPAAAQKSDGDDINLFKL